MLLTLTALAQECGVAPGVNSDLRILPDAGYVVVVLSNIDPAFAGRIGAWLKLRLNNQVR